MTLVDDLSRAVEAGDADEVVTLLLAVDESARRGAGPAVQDLCKTAEKADRWDVPQPEARRRYARYAAAQVAVFGTGTPAHVAAEAGLGGADRLRRLALARPRPWRQELADRAPAHWSWPLLRALVRDGDLGEPMTDAYVLGLLKLQNRAAIALPPLVDALRADPGLLSTTVWRLFEVEGGGEDSLAAHDKYIGPDNSWTQALTTLAATGELDRQRLLDASLAALRRDWSPFRAQWMTAFHTGLAPTVDEQAARAGDYAALLASQAPAVVGFAVTALTKVQGTGTLDPELLLGSAVPEVLARSKGTATAAVRLVARAGQSRPELAERVLLAAEGSEHPAVRAAAGKALSAMTGRAAPAPTPRPAVVAVAPPARQVAAVADLSQRTALTPVADLQDLATRLPGVLERADDPDELELVLDGLSRLCAEPDADRVLAPAAKRAAVLVRRDRDALTTVLAVVVDAWATGTPSATPEPSHERQGVRGSTRLQVRRLDELIDRLAARTPTPLVACPTHDGGWLDPDVLLARLESAPEPSDVELAVALLRLPTPPDGGLLDRAVTRVSSRGRLVRRQPSGPAVRAATVTEPELSLVVATAPDTHRFLTARPAQPVPLALHARVPVHDDGSWVRWTATVWPRGVRVRDAMAAELLAEDLDWWGARWGTIALLEPLLDSERPLGPEGCVLLALGLLCKQPAQRRVAVDAFVQAAEDGRLRGPELADALALVLPVALPSRLQVALTEAARAGEVPALVARDALLAVLPRTDPARKGLPGLVGLLADLAEAHGLPVDGTLDGWLAGRTGALGKQAQRLLAPA